MLEEKTGTFQHDVGDARRRWRGQHQMGGRTTDGKHFILHSIPQDSQPAGLFLLTFDIDQFR